MNDPSMPRKSSRPPAFRRGANTIAALMPQSVAPVLQQRGFASSALMSEWAEIAGAHLAKVATPLEIRWPKRRETTSQAPRSRKQDDAEKATLVLACPGAFALEVQMATPRLIETLNRRLGFAAIGTIIVQQTRRVPKPAPPAPLADDPALIAREALKLAHIQDEPLRQALATMSARVQQKNAPLK